MSEVTGSLSIPASPQSIFGAEHELSWFKIPYWLKGDEETRRVNPPVSLALVFRWEDFMTSNGWVSGKVYGLGHQSFYKVVPPQ